MAYSNIRPRRGTAYEWAVLNPVLDEGEIGIQCPDSGPGTGLLNIKQGDGVHHWNDLPDGLNGAAATKFEGGDSSDSNSGVFKIRSDTEANWMLNDPVLEKNELVFSTDVQGLKIGDGESTWSELSYISLGVEFDDNGNQVDDYGDEDMVDPSVVGTSDAYKSYAGKNSKTIDTYDRTILPIDWDKNLNRPK